MMNTVHTSKAAEAIIRAARQIDQRGWCPATSSNFSMRLDADHCAMTVSGAHKGQLVMDDIMVVDLQGRALDDRRPSAETLLHTTLYSRHPDIGVVLHTHSLYATLVSMQAEHEVSIDSLELLKAFEGITSHEQSLRIPVYDNSQDIAALASRVDADMQNRGGPGHAYLIRGHGLYTWGRDMQQAMRHLEALEFLLEYTWRLDERTGHAGRGGIRS